jgi:cytohesin
LGYYLYRTEYLPSELRVAATVGDLKRVQDLIAKGVDVNRRFGSASNSVLNRAIESGNSELVETVLRAGADPNAREDAGMTPMMLAAFFGYAGIVEKLINYGARIDTVEQDHNNTALLIAVRKNHATVVRVLLEHGADPNQGHEWGDAPLCRARARATADIAALLIARGAIC